MIEDIAIDFSNIPENVSKLVYAINVATSQVLTVNSKYVNGTRVYDVPNLVIKGGKFVTVFNISGLLYLNSPMHLENVTTTIATIRANGGSNFNRFTYKIRSITGSNVTGKRYLATNYGIIDTGNAGPEFFPGTIDGTCEDGGIYK